MNALPLISHRLFVSAASHEEGDWMRPPVGKSFGGEAPPARVLPVEVVTESRAPRNRRLRPLRMHAPAGVT